MWQDWRVEIILANLLAGGVGVSVLCSRGSVSNDIVLGPLYISLRKLSQHQAKSQFQASKLFLTRFYLVLNLIT